MNAESLIFDIDGTLWDSRALVAQGYNEQLAKEGREDLFVNSEIFLSLFGKVMTEIADVIFETIPVPQRYELMERCMDSEHRLLQRDPCHIGYPGVKETIQALAKNHRIFIVSNSQCGYPELCMDKLGLRTLIQDTLCFGDTGTEKGQTLLTLMKKHHITSCAYIGDTQGDYVATQVAGIPFVWAAYGFGTPEGFDAKADSFPQLLSIFASTTEHEG